VDGGAEKQVCLKGEPVRLVDSTKRARHQVDIRATGVPLSVDSLTVK
jgi:hypothetical protein